MTSFKVKTVGPRDALGSLFRTKRAERFLSVGAASRATGVARQYLEAIEEGRYGDLPGLVYGKSFVRAYSAYLGLAQAPLVHAFTEEYIIATAGQNERSGHYEEKTRVLITPMRVRVALAVVLVGMIGVYVSGEVTRLMRPPELTVFSPDDNIIITERSVAVAGTAEPEASITVNGEYIANDDGRYQSAVDLHDGVNTITVRAFRRHGRDQVVTRTVVHQGSVAVLKGDNL